MAVESEPDPFATLSAAERASGRYRPTIDNDVTHLVGPLVERASLLVEGSERLAALDWFLTGAL